MKNSLKIVTTDGYVLSATWFVPDQSNGNVVLINSATGVKQRYYEDFAHYLANQGFYVYTYDYRGIGASKPKRLRGFNVSMADWALLDYQTMLKNVFQSHPRSKVIVLGHSVGGQLIGFSPLSAKADAFVTVGAQTPYWKNFDGRATRLKLRLLWYILIPVLTKLVGYFPASKLKLFEDLPREAALQWARWAKTKSYVFNDLPELRQNFSTLNRSALMLSFSDDRFAPQKAVLDLMQFYSNVKWEHWHLQPEDVLQREVGHFGFFRKRMEPILWRETVEWMKKTLSIKEIKAA
ncbi:MAG: alpha/beta fold hydrolase [Bacteroidota bacterium]